MKHWERICELHKLLLVRRTPISRRALEQQLDCSRATLHRVIADLRDGFGAPIEYSSEHRGYWYRRDGEQPIELPGQWFTAEELRALVVLHQLLAESQPRLFDRLLGPLHQRIDRVLANPQVGGTALLSRVRIFNRGRREPDAGVFERAAAGLLQRRRLDIVYAARGTAEQTRRTVSPQRLVHYRDNWYLCAWCHHREALRAFALERIAALDLLDAAAEDIPEDHLDRHYAAGYGIFAGPPRHTALLRFTAARARWVAEENWCPGAVGEFLADGGYVLRIPYSDPTELIMDILHYGPDVDVLEPLALREQVTERLRQTLTRYELQGQEG